MPVQLGPAQLGPVHRQARVAPGLRRRAARLSAAVPLLTAGLVLVVGVGLAVRSLG
jgi:hypothetical protein